MGGDTEEPEAEQLTVRAEAPSLLAFPPELAEDGGFGGGGSALESTLKLQEAEPLTRFLEDEQSVKEALGEETAPSRKKLSGLVGHEKAPAAGKTAPKQQTAVKSQSG